MALSWFGPTRGDQAGSQGAPAGGLPAGVCGLPPGLRAEPAVERPA